VVSPEKDGDLSEFLRWLTVTHTQRFHAHYHSVGTGPLYQGRFKSFPIQDDEHLLTVMRYFERNALRAELVRRAEDWRWSSLWQRVQGRRAALLDRGPVRLPAAWVEHVNRPETEAELAVVRRSVLRGSPFGETSWVEQTVGRLGLKATMRPRGRPKKVSATGGE
jgi:putative transposase